MSISLEDARNVARDILCGESNCHLPFPSIEELDNLRIELGGEKVTVQIGIRKSTLRILNSSNFGRSEKIAPFLEGLIRVNLRKILGVS